MQDIIAEEGVVRAQTYADIIDILNEDLKWDLHDVVAEGAYGQYELDFGYTDMLGMADRFIFLRVLLKEIAKKH